VHHPQREAALHREPRSDQHRKDTGNDAQAGQRDSRSGHDDGYQPSGSPTTLGWSAAHGRDDRSGR